MGRVEYAAFRLYVQEDGTYKAFAQVDRVQGEGADKKVVQKLGASHEAAALEAVAVALERAGIQEE